MALKKRYLLSGVVAVLAFSSLARAQTVQPFIDPGYFDYDMQLFAPADDLDAYGGDPVQKHGWFGSYSRMYISVSRPNQNQFQSVFVGVGSPDVLYYTPPNPGVNQAVNQAYTFVPTPAFNTALGQDYDILDKTWGNRVDLGYMTDEDNGWLFSYMHIAGPNKAQITHQQRYDRFNPNDTGASSTGSNNNNNNSTTTTMPVSDLNNIGPPNPERSYDITNSLNFGKLTSLELNKSFRMAPLNHGGILEPFLGVRYFRFEDSTVRQDYTQTTSQYQTNTPQVLVNQPITTVDPITGATTVRDNYVPIPNPPGITAAEALLSENFLFRNDIFGGQLGLRWYRRASRWNLSSDFRAFAGENFQHLHYGYDREFTFYGGAAQGTGTTSQSPSVTKIENRQTTQDFNSTQAVVGSDIRAEAAYDVTRDVQLSVGMQFLGFFNGIGRGGSIAYNNGNVMMVGLAFGFVWNR